MYSEKHGTKNSKVFLNFKKALSLVLVSILSIFLVVGCGKTSSSTKSVNSIKKQKSTMGSSVKNSGTVKSNSNIVDSPTAQYYRDKAAALQQEIQLRNLQHQQEVQEDLERAQRQHDEDFAKSFAY